MARPRRFGKSLLISTLAELFKGNKELFKGLAIDEKTNYDWTEYPVIHLDLSIISIQSRETVQNGIALQLKRIAKRYNIDLSSEDELNGKLLILIEELAVKNPVVVLIDEYDAPLVNNIGNPQLAEEILIVLKEFYSTLKGLDKYLQFLFVTGVTKYAKTSLFSGLNNLNDISLDPRACKLLGYTKKEIQDHFETQLAELAQSQDMTVDATLDKLRHWYNGYRFSEEKTYVYNPFSILYCLLKKKFDNYWFDSGAPSFMVQLLEKHKWELREIKEKRINIRSLGSFEIGEEPLVPILVQAGYLTISDYERVVENGRESTYIKVKYANLEVAESFKKYVIAALTSTSYRGAEALISDISEALAKGDIDRFCHLLRCTFAHIPYQLHMAAEAYYHSLMQLLLTLLNFKVESEMVTDKGRIDMVLKTNTHIYIIEFKFNGSPDDALDQIEKANYAQKYELDNKKIVLVGMSFKQDKERFAINHKIKE